VHSVKINPLITAGIQCSTHGSTTTGATLARTARSQLPRAVEHVLRSPVVTARGLAEDLAITPQAALRLLRHLIAAGVIREATGRAAWRAFTMA